MAKGTIRKKQWVIETINKMELGTQFSSFDVVAKIKNLYKPTTTQVSSIIGVLNRLGYVGIVSNGGGKSTIWVVNRKIPANLI